MIIFKGISILFSLLMLIPLCLAVAQDESGSSELFESEDTEAPQLQIIGTYKTTIAVGQQWEEPAVNASDNVDGDVTGNISIDGEVNTEKAGTYAIVYSVTDKAGNRAEKKITVTVTAANQESQDTDIFAQQSGDPLENNTTEMISNSSSSRKDSEYGSSYNRREKNGYSASSIVPKPKNHRRITVGWTTFLCGAGAGAGGYILDKYILPQKFKAYQQAGNKEDAVANRRTVEQLTLYRDLCYGSGSVLGLGFVVNFIW
ncbi:MAG: DUF5011 domain-containing protein [Chitinivibrionales bacterium]|nr:DUF5011 domain-containing protein [Chitinivibrionales bacterium]